ncbi:MAG: hypothetical protein IKV67_06610 [Paludibacteraceae bacterium]|nr:hypothetical protein [Paludibacteraceae bacterium]
MKTNGRIICDELKRVRLELAKANGIDYQPTVCNHQGECSGTCPKCEAELAELTRQIKEKKSAKVIGIAPLKVAAVAAATATALSLSACHEEEGDMIDPSWNDSTSVKKQNVLDPNVLPADSIPVEKK